MLLIALLLVTLDGQKIAAFRAVQEPELVQVIKLILFFRADLFGLWKLDIFYIRFFALLCFHGGGLKHFVDVLDFSDVHVPVRLGASCLRDDRFGFLAFLFTFPLLDRLGPGGLLRHALPLLVLLGLQTLQLG